MPLQVMKKNSQNLVVKISLSILDNDILTTKF